MPNSLQLVSSCATCVAAILSTIGSERGVVGMLWSAVAMVRSGRRTFRPRSRKPREGLRRRDFVHQVQIDVEQRRRARLLGTTWRVPELFDDGTWFRHYELLYRGDNCLADFCRGGRLALPASDPPSRGRC